MSATLTLCSPPRPTCVVRFLQCSSEFEAVVVSLFPRVVAVVLTGSLTNASLLLSTSVLVDGNRRQRRLRLRLDASLVILFKEVRALGSLGYRIPFGVTLLASRARAVYPYAVAIDDALEARRRTAAALDSLTLVNGGRGSDADANGDAAAAAASVVRRRRRDAAMPSLARVRATARAVLSGGGRTTWADHATLATFAEDAAAATSKEVVSGECVFLSFNVVLSSYRHTRFKRGLLITL